ncbi:hypothetical protein BJX63DRAFT_438540 [Aspergillus granulosus]|uniref:Uncharacterized protein n=1 Tax=Aspergillus granulosus TaxID=176169 RepID=A0ABR4GTE7_9EURO
MAKGKKKGRGKKSQQGADEDEEWEKNPKRERQKEEEKTEKTQKNKDTQQKDDNNDDDDDDVSMRELDSEFEKPDKEPPKPPLCRQKRPKASDWAKKVIDKFIEKNGKKITQEL